MERDAEGTGKSGETLEDLRAGIDRADDALIEALLERADLVRRVALAKQDARRGTLALRPGREAVIARKVARRLGCALPPATAVAIWRELLSAFTSAQTPFAVAVTLGGSNRDALGLWELARGHFGASVPLLRAEAPEQALRWLKRPPPDSEGPALAGGPPPDLAVLPIPAEGEDWWLNLPSALEACRGAVLGRLPMAAHPRLPQALLVGPGEAEPSGDDLALLMVKTSAPLSRSRLLDLLRAAGLQPRSLAAGDLEGGGAAHLIEVAGFVEEATRRSRGALSATGACVAVLGGYPRPLEPPG